LINWNKTFECAANQFFMPESTQQAISQLNFKKALVDWLVNDVNILLFLVFILDWDDLL